ncbi:unnamed protein product, partial [Polarella glacialis]
DYLLLLAFAREAAEECQRLGAIASSAAHGEDDGHCAEASQSIDGALAGLATDLDQRRQSCTAQFGQLQ